MNPVNIVWGMFGASHAPSRFVPPVYCLVKCEGWDRYDLADSQPVAAGSVTKSWCIAAGATMCAWMDLEMEDMCWGVRD